MGFRCDNRGALENEKPTDQEPAMSRIRHKITSGEVPVSVTNLKWSTIDPSWHKFFNVSIE